MLNKATLGLWARRLKANLLAIWIASRDSRTPPAAKLIAVFVAGYAFSPIDLIPDFIPIIGYLDDLIIIPAGIAIVIRLIPQKLMHEFTLQAEKLAIKPVGYVAATVVVAVWIIVGIILFVLLQRGI